MLTLISKFIKLNYKGELIVNIFVCGLPKTGKTTLCKNLKKELPNYNIFVSEALRNGFQKMDIDNAKSWGNKTSKQRTQDFPVFLKEFLQWNEKFTQNSNIVDSALLDLKTITEIASNEDIIVCLGFGGKTQEEILKIIRENEAQQDYTKNFSDKQLLSFWGDIEKQDNQNKNFCKENSIFYFDITKNRENLLQTVLNLFSDNNSIKK